MRVAGGPAIVVPCDSKQDTRTRLRLAKLRVAPRRGERTRKLGVMGMRDEPPSRF
jgi:hypothetical protein